MHSQHQLQGPDLSTRLNIMSSTLPLVKSPTQTLTSRHQHLSARHTHRKYKLSHSQFHQINQLSINSNTNSKLNNSPFHPSTYQKPHFTHNQPQNHPTQNQPKHQSLSTKNYLIQHTLNYSVTKDIFIQLENDTSLRVQVIQFKIPLIDNMTKPINVICFQVHIGQIDTHLRSEFTYETLPSEFRLIFDDLDEIFDYVAFKEEWISFNVEKLELVIRVEFSKGPQTKIKFLKVYLLPFALIQIAEHEAQQDSSDQETKKKLQQMHKDLQIQTDRIAALRSENDQLRFKLQSKEKEVEDLRKDNNMLSESFQQMSRASETCKDYFFEFVPDPRAKNISHFSLKNNLLVKHKNDIKWDQLSSEAPLPQTHRHYFTLIPQTPTPDCMLGIVTLKGKDTPNAFLGMEVICIYLSKSNVFVYERGRHYKVNRAVGVGEMVIVVVDKERGVVEWMKMIGMGTGSEQIEKQKETETTKTGHENSSGQIQVRARKSLQTISIQKSSLNGPVQPSIYRQTQFLHSTKIPPEMLSHELYAYLQVYNVNEPLRLNGKR